MREAVLHSCIFVALAGSVGSEVQAGMTPTGHFVREPYFGVVGRPCELPDPSLNLMKPDVAYPSPPGETDAQAVNDFLSSAKAADRSKLEKVVSSKWLSSKEADSCILAASKIPDSCLQEPLYLLGDMEVRVDWVCGRNVSYELFFTLKKGKITNVWSIGHNNRPVVVRG